ncbi:unnamed protein product [Meganyctiphanes norvegica]|uniref:Spondin domain-containing protein n=1 Tax=Meganyctiphanes norvegica TaxID=48144 RepID=A0AAV2Q9S7_MEGNR
MGFPRPLDWWVLLCLVVVVAAKDSNDITTGEKGAAQGDQVLSTTPKNTSASANSPTPNRRKFPSQRIWPPVKRGLRRKNGRARPVAALPLGADTAATGPRRQCPGSELALYRLTLETHWTPRDFPKHYPEWRPPAQWSKLIGQSHDSSWVLFRAGKEATPAIKSFAEVAKSDLIDYNAQGSNGVLDAFNGPPITVGAGTTEVHFFADGNHSLLSCSSKMVPSPDWFIGVDSFQLCEGGHWIDNVKIQVDPLDAGTDNGLTFTSPNWPTSPAEKIYRITANYPDHPAHSLHYPTLRTLPRIATFSISKIREYKETRTHQQVDKSTYNVINFEDKLYQHLKKQKPIKNEVSTILREENNSIYKDNIQANRFSYLSNVLPTDDPRPPPTTPSPSTTSSTTTTTKTTTTSSPPISLDDTPVTTDEPSTTTKVSKDRRTEPNYALHHERRVTVAPTSVPRWYKGITEPGVAYEVHSSTAPSQSPYDDPQTRISNQISSTNVRTHSIHNRIPTGDAMAVLDDILKKTRKDQRRKMKKHRREEKRNRRLELKKIRPPRDCRVSEWSEWSSCSKTCGIGERKRTRTILKHARRGGKSCPVLDETTWCGSARACPRNYFNWSK